MEMLRNAVRFKCGIRDLHREEGGHSVLLQRGGRAKPACQGDEGLTRCSVRYRAGSVADSFKGRM